MMGLKPFEFWDYYKNNLFMCQHVYLSRTKKNSEPGSCVSATANIWAIRGEISKLRL
jgi:hypothetical protein